MQHRTCRVCGETHPIEAFRRGGRRNVRRRTCRGCESRRRARWGFRARALEIPVRYRDPELSLGEIHEIRAAEQLERRGAEA